MKMEIPVVATGPGIILSILVQEGGAVAEGDIVAILDPR
jgi:biotin carboxyl carrier protein